MGKWMRTTVFVLASFVSVNVAAATTLKCIGHGENLYMNDSLHFSIDDLIDRVPLKEKKTINVVFGENEMDVNGTMYENYYRDSGSQHGSYDKTGSAISGSKYIKFPIIHDELTQYFFVDRLTGEFESKINWVTTGNDTSFPTYAEKEYGRGVDRIMIVKGTCKLSSRAF